MATKKFGLLKDKVSNISEEAPSTQFKNALMNYLSFFFIILVEVSEENCDAFILLFFFDNLTVWC